MSEVFPSAGQPGALSCSKGLQFPLLVMVRGRWSAANPEERRFIFADPLGKEVCVSPDAVLGLSWFSRLDAEDQQWIRTRLANWARVDRDAAEASGSAQ